MNFDEWRETYSAGPLMNEAMARAAWDAAIAAERAACAEHYLAVMRKAIEEEREACAKLCETQQSNWNYCAAAIRARSST